MEPRQLDRLFERFRRYGDVGALAEIFDETAPELYRVAIHLTRDLHAAEDLVQATFVAAIEARAIYDAKRELLPWLLGILTRTATWERRKLSRVIESDRLTPQGDSAPDAEAQTRELSDIVLAALDHMPAPYREVLSAHLRAGKAPQEIARDLGRAPGTVRVQLHRGLDMLRKSLPFGFAVGAAQTALTPRGLSAVRETVLATAARSTGVVPAVPNGTLSSNLIGGASMGIKSVLGTGLLMCLAWLGYRALPGPNLEPDSTDVASSPPIQTSATRALPLQTPTDETRAVRVVERTVVPERIPGPVSSDLNARGRTRLSGRLLLQDGEPSAGTFVALMRIADEMPEGLATEEARTGTDGKYSLSADAGRYLFVGLDKGSLPVCTEVVLVEGTEVRLDTLTCIGASHITGRVWIGDLHAPAECKVVATLPGVGKRFSLDQRSFEWTQGRLRFREGFGSTDAEGHFSILGLEPQMHHVALDTLPGLRILGASWEILAPTTNAVLAVDHARLILHMRSAGEDVPAHVSLTGGHERIAKGKGSTWGFWPAPIVDVLVPPGAPYTVDVQQEGFKSQSFEVVAPASGETLERDVELSRDEQCSTLVVTLIPPDAQPIRQATFALFNADPSMRTRSLASALRFPRIDPAGRSPAVVQQVNEVGGTFTIEKLPAGRYDVSVALENYWRHDPIQVELAQNDVQYHRIELTVGGRFQARCTETGGKALGAQCILSDSLGQKVPIAFSTKGPGGVWGGAKGMLNPSVPDGLNTLATSLPPGRYELRFSLDGFVDATRSVVIEPGKTVRTEMVLQTR